MKHRFFHPKWSEAKRATADLLKRLHRDESGQSMTEYILILFLVVLIFNQLKKGLIGRITGLVSKVGSDLDSATSDSGAP